MFERVGLPLVLSRIIQQIAFGDRTQCEAKNNFPCSMGRAIKRDSFDDRI